MKHPELFKDFDPYAMAKPKTREDVIALLREMNSMLEDMLVLWESVFTLKKDPQ